MADDVPARPRRAADRRARLARPGAGRGAGQAPARACSCSTGPRCRTARASPPRLRAKPAVADDLCRARTLTISPARRRRSRALADGAWRHRHPDQQRRPDHQPAVRGVLARRVRGPGPGQLLRRLCACPRRRAGHEGEGLRQDRQLLLAHPERPLGFDGGW